VTGKCIPDKEQGWWYRDF